MLFSSESPHRGDSNEYTQHATINIKSCCCIVVLRHRGDSNEYTQHATINIKSCCCIVVLRPR